MIATLSFDLSKQCDAEAYRLCHEIVFAPPDGQCPRLSRFLAALSPAPRSFVLSLSAFGGDYRWSLVEWAAAAGVSASTAKALLGPLARIARSHGWSPFVKLDQANSPHLYCFAEGAFEELVRVSKEEIRG